MTTYVCNHCEQEFPEVNVAGVDCGLDVIKRHIRLEHMAPLTFPGSIMAPPPPWVMPDYPEMLWGAAERWARAVHYIDIENPWHDYRPDPDDDPDDWDWDWQTDDESTQREKAYWARYLTDAIDALTESGWTVTPPT